MAFEGKIELSWEDHIEDGYVTVYGEAENEEGETKQASEDIYLEDFSQNDIDNALYGFIMGGLERRLFRNDACGQV